MKRRENIHHLNHNYENVISFTTVILFIMFLPALSVYHKKKEMLFVTINEWKQRAFVDV
jgi:hypothetical protein